MPLVASFAVPHPPLIIPDVGKGSEQQVKRTIESYDRIAREISYIEPETIIISSPHTVAFKDYLYISSTPTMKGSFIEFGAGNVSFNETIDVELANEIERVAHEESFPAGKIDKEVELDGVVYYTRAVLREELQKNGSVMPDNIFTKIK